MVLINKNMKIKFIPKHNAYEISIGYQEFINQLEGLSKSNIFFSTYRHSSALDGFIPLEDSMYVRLSIIHKLGSIVKIEDVIGKKGLIKMKVVSSKKTLVITVFTEVFKDLALGFFETKFNIRYSLLNDFYIDLALASNRELIIERWNNKALPDQNALKKDHKESDYNRFRWSQNADGGRKRNELLTGNGNNLVGSLKMKTKKGKKMDMSRF